MHTRRRYTGAVRHQGGDRPGVGTYTDKDGDVQHKGDGQLARGEQAKAPEPVTECRQGNSIKKTVNGLEITTDTCADSRLQPHDGFQKGDRCISTEFGEVGDAAKNPTLLITEFPERVQVGQPFTLKVSTRNLVRDRFLAAGQGGYYVESSVLTAEGLVRGHFHTACRMLESTDAAVDPSPVPAFFVATEDKRGGAEPDTVTIQVPGMPQEGTAQCASWAGDGSHRVPMMQRANQTPAIDAVRLTVQGDNGNGDGDQGDGDQGDGDQGDGDNGNGQDNGDQGDNGDGNQGGDNGAGQDNGGDQGTGDGQDDGDQGDGQGNSGGDQGGDNAGNQNGDGQNNGGDQGGDAPAQPTTPRTDAGTTPPKAPTVTIPPKTGAGQATTAPKPTRAATKPVAAEDEKKDDSKKATSAATNKPTQAAAEAEETEEAETTREPAAERTTETTEVQASDDDRLALTGANVTTVALGGTILILGGLFALSVTRRRRSDQD